MADYRLSAQVISRGKGQSSVASAAYRSASRLVDERTGEIHDYGRKGGLIHSEVMTPEGTPDWMQDRAQLWNAVEAVERRKDAQLAREVQLSLPHELTQAQRQALVLGFVQEQFVSRGMIADVAIHAPSDKGDQRNHHAHVMLTMRNLTVDGFGKKNRDWNSPEVLEQWRENWARHQNRALERHGHEARVDHRSYEAQGIDREPSQHLGPVASDMERNGNPSRIGDENRAIANDNAERVRDHIEAARLASEIAREKWKFGQWAEYKRGEIQNAQRLADLDLDQKQHRQALSLEAQLEKIYGPVKATIQAEIDSVERRLAAQGVRKILRNVFGRTRSDRQVRDELKASLRDIENREQEQRQILHARQDRDRTKEDDRQQRNRERLERGIQTARERREATDWTPRPATPERPSTPLRGDPRGSFSKNEPSERPAEDFDKPTLADKTTKPGVQRLEERMNQMERAWDKLDRLSSLDRQHDRDADRSDEREEGEREERGRSAGRGPAPD